MASGTFTLIFGAGERLATLRTLLAALPGAPPVRAIDDLAQLLEAPEAVGTLVLDSDRLAAEDFGFVRRFTSRSPGFRVVLVGDDASRRVARELLRSERSRWIAWPPDVEHLVELAAAAPRSSALPAAIPAADPTVRPLAGQDELSQIESILGTPLGTRAPRAPAPPADGGRARAGGPAPYFRDQVADLADIAQRIELTLDLARENAEDGAPLDGLSSEVQRLLQFTRTLGYLVAPPAAGEQVFDVGEMIDVLISGGDDSPRYVFRRDRALFVRSDRQLLGQAFDAFLCLAKGAGRGELVRVEVQGAADDDPSFGVVTIEFPAGALRGVELAKATEPYALRRVLPELGPNALAAAIGIVAGQGGRAELHPSTEGRLEWTIRLRAAPRAEPSVAATGAKLARDPFR